MNKYKSPVLPISAIPEIAVASMNATHREEVELINQLGELLVQATNGKMDEAAITEKLNEWVEHTRQHFESENRLMEEFAFPALPVHRNEHEQVFARIESLQQQWLETRNPEPLAEFIFLSWPRWFDMHVNTMDMVTAQFINMRLS